MLEGFVYVVVLWIGSNYNIIVHPEMFRSYEDCRTFSQFNADLLNRTKPTDSAMFVSRCVSLKKLET